MSTPVDDPAAPAVDPPAEPRAVPPPYRGSGVLRQWWPFRVTEVGDAEVVDLERHPRASLLTALVLVALVAAVVLGLRSSWTRSQGVPSPDRVVLPSVDGRSAADAQRDLEALGVLVAVEFTPNDVVPAGTAFRQSPRAGAKVEPGSEVTVEVSDGPAGAIVPSVSGVQAPVAESLLTSLGLTPERRGVPSDVIRPGEVVGTLPAAGARAPSSGAVVLEVSDGPAPRTVPEIVGSPVGPGLSSLGRAGLGLGDVTTVVRDGVEPGTVLEVRPGPGTELGPMSPVDVVVSGSPDPVTAPPLVGLLRASAEQVAGDRFPLRVRERPVAANDPLVGRVIEQSVPVGTPAPPGTAIEIVVGVAAR
mgnify:CR=1 FL=1